MARNVVILSPHFPPHYHRFWHQVRRAGGTALGIGDAPYEGGLASRTLPRPEAGSA